MRGLPILLTAVVLVTACGGASQVAAPSPTPTASPSPSPSPSPTPSPSPEPTVGVVVDDPIAVAYLARATSYTLVALPNQTANQLASGLTAVPGLGQYITGFAARSVTTKAGDPVALALVLSLDPSYAALPGVYDGLVKGIAGPNRVAQQETLAGRQAAYFDDLGGIAGLTWLQRRFIVILYGKNRTSMEQLGTALISANQ